MISISRLVGLAAIAILSTSAAFAQVPDRIGMFGHIDGRWMWLGGSGLQIDSGTPPQVSNGPGGQVMLGYKFDPNWDVALAGDIQQLFTEVTRFRGGTLAVDTTHQHVDLEVGYSKDRWRLSAGLRGIHYLQHANYNTPAVAGYDQREMYGIGPKLGAGVRLPLSPGWALLAEADFALVYTSYADTGGGAVIANGNYAQFVPQFDAELGVNWRTHDDLSVTVGPRIATSFNTAIADYGSRQGTLLEYGPFVRIAYNFGGGIRPLATATTAAAGDSPVAAAPDYLVFFDSDERHIPLVAAGAIGQAARDARRGRPVIIQTTGHADEAGDAAYNEALSRRRAQAVRDELVRQGLPRENIAVIRRDECERRVQTAAALGDARTGLVQISF